MVTRTGSFTCEHCQATVGAAGHNRNSCPACHWSKHVLFGDETGCPPCGALMKPVRRILIAGLVLWECQGCPFMIRGPSERELKRIRRAGGKVSWRTGVQGGTLRHQIVEHLRAA